MDGHDQIKRYYDQEYSKYREHAFPFDQKRYAQLFSHIVGKPHQDAKVLDIGCGAGYLCGYLEKLNYRVAGVDISREAVRLARKRVPSGNFSAIDPSNRLNFQDRTFDLITCMGVLEHIPKPEKILQEAYRVLKNGGEAVFLVPNARSPYFWFGAGTGQIHEQPRSYKSWHRLFESAGFSVLNVQRDPGPTLESHEKFFKKTKIFLLKIMNRLPVQYTYQFNFLLEK